MTAHLPAGSEHPVDDEDGALLTSWAQNMSWRSVPNTMVRALLFTFRGPGGRCWVDEAAMVSPCRLRTYQPAPATRAPIGPDSPDGARTRRLAGDTCGPGVERVTRPRGRTADRRLRQLAQRVHVEAAKPAGRQGRWPHRHGARPPPLRVRRTLGHACTALASSVKYSCARSRGVHSSKVNIC